MSYALNRFGSALFSNSRIPSFPHSLTHSPLFVSVEPANVCQLKCPACPVGLRNAGMPGYWDAERFMSKQVWERVLAECRDTAWVMQFYFQGEPLLNKDLPRMIRDAHEAGLYTIVSTNAQAMTQEMAQALVESGLDRIIISMDGLTDESYNAYRVGGSLEKCKEALRWLREAKEQFQISNFKFQIELQVLRLRTNEHEWAAFKKQYKVFGADRLVFKTAQLYDYANGHPLMPSNPKFSRYVQGKDGLYHRRRLRNGCFRVWSGCVITTTGEVLPCCYDKSHAYAYGNIMNTRMRELFGNEKAVTFRQAAFRQKPKICQECYK